MPRSAIIVGGGYIGLEMADALTRRGIGVTLVQRGPSVLNTIIPSLSHLIVDELHRHGVAVFTNVAVTAIERSGAELAVIANAGFRRVADFVLVATGVRPASELAQRAGITTGMRGAISVTRAMETSLTGIYAAGDCVETWHRLLQRSLYLPLGTTAHKQGRVAGENAARDLADITGRRQFAGSIGTQVVKVFDLAVARTGLLEAEAQAAGFAPFTTKLTTWDHKRYYPGAHELHMSVTGDHSTGRLLGAHIVGHWKSEVVDTPHGYSRGILGSTPQPTPRLPEGFAQASLCFWRRYGHGAGSFHSPGTRANGRTSLSGRSRRSQSRSG
jgi:pyruvate/2-oxoglutarate dehydrogenase complex dihydrolipoamide dehydrogenase (E3) component